ncbi:hypothetical protein N8928_01875 [Planktomarina temperata]|jgi:hypothetical protein|nr:hypothetical protein [Planktomarina temperata]MDA7471643.1 hypothetical protein [Planktomarina temperata]
MSDTDSFIDEVTEEVRRDRLFGYFRRYGWIPAVIIFALVGGTAYNEWSKAQVAQVAQARGDALLDALQLEDEAKQAAALSAIAREEGDTLVAKLLAAGVEADQAADLLRSVADDATQPQYIRDLARLKMASTDGVLTLDEAAAILAELSEPGGVYRNVATELLVAVHLQRGETQAALELLQAHIKDAEAGSEQIQRMAELIVALGASPELAN